MDRYFYVCGLIHEKLVPYYYPRGFMIHEDEEPKLKYFIGKPVYLEHDKNKLVLGEVLKYIINKRGDIFVILRLDLYIKEAYEVSELIKSNYYQGLSMGYTSIEDAEGKNRYSKIVPKEVSICVEGAINRSKILFYGNYFSYKIKKIAWEEIFFTENLMTTPENNLEIDLDKLKELGLIPGTNEFSRKLEYYKNLDKRVKLFNDERNSKTVDHMTTILSEIDQLNPLNSEDLKAIEPLITSNELTDGTHKLIELMASGMSNFKQKHLAHLNQKGVAGAIMKKLGNEKPEEVVDNTAATAATTAVKRATNASNSQSENKNMNAIRKLNELQQREEGTKGGFQRTGATLG